MRRWRYLAVGLLVLGSLGVVIASGVVGASAASSTNGSEATGNEAFAYNVSQTGPTLTLEQLKELIVKRAGEAGTQEGSVEVAKSSLRSAEAVVDPHSEPPANPTGGMAAWLASEVYVATVRGHFSGGGIPTPPNEPEPTGTVMTFIVDAHTGFIDSWALRSTAVDLSKLGPVAQVGGAS